MPLLFHQKNTRPVPCVQFSQSHQIKLGILMYMLKRCHIKLSFSYYMLPTSCHHSKNATIRLGSSQSLRIAWLSVEPFDYYVDYR